MNEFGLIFKITNGYIHQKYQNIISVSTYQQQCVLLWKVCYCDSQITSHTVQTLKLMLIADLDYRKLSNISHTKPYKLNVSRLDLQMSLRNILEPSVKWRMKM